MKKKLFIALSIISGMLIFLNSCNNPGVSPTVPDKVVQHKISGKVIDSYTGSPVSGAKVGFGTHVETTDTNGNYSFTTDDGKTLTGNFYVSKDTSYKFLVVNGIDITPDSDLVYNIKISPNATSSYTIHTLTGTVIDNTGSVMKGQDITLDIYNENGGYSKFTTTTDSSSGVYTVSTATFGSSCLIVIFDGTSTYYVENTDLSGDSTTLDLTEPADSAFTTVNVYGAANDLFFVSMIYSASITLKYYGGNLAQLPVSANVGSIKIFNPDGKEFLWTKYLGTTSGTTTTLQFSTSPASIPGTAVILPPFTSTATVAASNIGYVNNTISFNGDANLFNIELLSDEGYNGIVFSNSNSVILPDDIVSILESSAASNWDAYISSVNATVDMDLPLTLATYLQDYPIYHDLDLVVYFDSSNYSATDLIP